MADNEIINRIEELEVLLQPNGNKHTIHSQLQSLRIQVSKIYKEHQELHQLEKLVTEHGLKNGLLDIINTGEDESTDPETKKRAIILQEQAIKEAHNNYSQLTALNTDRMINYIGSSQDKVYNFNDVYAQIQLRKTVLEDLASKMHLLTLKSMVVYEKYVNTMNKENKFWLESNERLDHLNLKVKKFEKTKMPKY